MNNRLLKPAHADDLITMMAAEKFVLPVGNRTKAPLSASADAALISLGAFRGIIEYEPSEFTFTARAGTPIADIQTALAEKGQYLPFDPMLVEAGATIGGTAAAGLSGPGRFRYGGIRDFLLGARFVSGDGQTICAGGKVVKNAAGFDLPKFLVGSMGRMGVLLELTFKVFPKPSALRTLRVQCDSHTQALARMAKAACSRWELDAIDYRPGERSMVLRLAGPARAIESIDHEIGTTWGEDVAELPLADTFWQSVNELNWSAPGAAAVKVPTTPPQCIALHQGLAGEEAIAMHGSVAGNVAWLLVASTDGLAAVDRQLQVMNIPGLVVRGTYDTPYLGVWQSPKIQQAVQAAMDPPAKFLSLYRHPRPPAQVN